MDIGKYIKRLGLFLTFMAVAYVATYAIVDYARNTEKAEDTIFIWGDSQAFRGINIEEMSALTGKRVLTAAADGAGVYDFLVFAHKVPRNATVIVALSETTLLRRKERDRNWSGISPGALLALFRKHYDVGYLWGIVRKNLAPPKLYISHVNLFPASDVVLVKEPIATFVKIFSSKPDYLEVKEDLFIEGIKTLKKKNCRIAFIELPYHPVIEVIEDRSPLKQYIESFRERVMNLFDKYDIEDIEIDTRVAMYDLSHLNVYGATMVAKKLARLLGHSGVTTLYHVRGQTLMTGGRGRNNT